MTDEQLLELIKQEFWYEKQEAQNFFLLAEYLSKIAFKEFNKANTSKSDNIVYNITIIDDW